MYIIVIYTHAGVHLSLKGVFYANNSIILITDVGETNTSSASPPLNSNKGLQCITDKMPCCRTSPNRAGEWHFPDSYEGLKTIPKQDSSLSFYRNRGYNDDGSVNLNRKANIKSPTGLFCCIVPDALNINQILCANIGMH